MTALETKALAPGDRVACGKHVGRVVSLAMYTVRIEWQPGQPTIHERDQMDKIRPASPRRHRSASLTACDRRKETPVVFHQDTLDAIRQAETDGGIHADP